MIDATCVIERIVGGHWCRTHGVWADDHKANQPDPAVQPDAVGAWRANMLKIIRGEMSNHNHDYARGWLARDSLTHSDATQEVERLRAIEKAARELTLANFAVYVTDDDPEFSAFMARRDALIAALSVDQQGRDEP